MVLKLANLCEWHLITATMMQLGGYVKVDICFRTRELENLKSGDHLNSHVCHTS